MDPKEHWAQRHPECFPLDVNRADRFELLRVPGLGLETADRILRQRTSCGRLISLNFLGKLNQRLAKALGYLKFGDSPRVAV